MLDEVSAEEIIETDEQARQKESEHSTDDPSVTPMASNVLAAVSTKAEAVKATSISGS